ncbi:hypothetical protein AVEN_161202-1 [Araneus ventricosus]|uniref:Uncharacterized protein n=1 Tax=Araneus ventricosus TaxID=182803 RepID=A0A4Y2XBQ6_ARAVE|nr:hypothetical protein AVEN_161202-1 [Araneus ventricosus]
MGKRKSGPFSGQQIESTSSLTHFPTFFLIKRNSTSNETFHTVSPFLVEKAITATVGEVKSTKKLRSGDLLVEVHSRKQSEQIVKLKTFSNIPISVSQHATPPKELSPAENCLMSLPKKSLKNCKDRGSKPPDSIERASPPITNLVISSSPSVAPVSELALASPSFTDFKLVANKKKLEKDSPTKTIPSPKLKRSQHFTQPLTVKFPIIFQQMVISVLLSLH